ncbi:MAG: hypothetical protein AAB376_00245 [Pseudomonadota bacterium]
MNSLLGHDYSSYRILQDIPVIIDFQDNILGCLVNEIIPAQ